MFFYHIFQSHLNLYLQLIIHLNYSMILKNNNHLMYYIYFLMMILMLLLIIYHSIYIKNFLILLQEYLPLTNLINVNKNHLLNSEHLKLYMQFLEYFFDEGNLMLILYHLFLNLKMMKILSLILQIIYFLICYLLNDILFRNLYSLFLNMFYEFFYLMDSYY